MICLLAACNQGGVKSDQANHSGWKAVYKHDEHGNAVAGDIETLIDGIRRGYAVRVGWGWEKEITGSLVKLEHMAEPLFLTIIRQEHVSVVIDAHPLMESYIDVDKQAFREGGHIWQCVLTTQGTFNAKVYNRATGELIRDWPQRQLMTWFLEYPARSPAGDVTPLYQRR